MRIGDFTAAYLHLERSGELALRAARLRAVYRSCRLCPRGCAVDRTRGELGVCGTPARAVVAAAHPHFGEERPLVGSGGSGTIFFAGCNLLCAYCQNWQIAHRRDGDPAGDEELGRIMIGLQEAGCHNINLVTPTHVLPSIVGALRIAIRLGLRVPLVYNCGGYESLEILRLLDGIVDIYLPDFKYADGAVAARLSSGARDYPRRAAAAVVEMHRQVGTLVLDDAGIALRGLIIRHLVLPNGLAGTARFVRFVASRIGREACLNLMSQYRPEYLAHGIPEIARPPSAAEYRDALACAARAGVASRPPGD